MRKSLQLALAAILAASLGSPLSAQWSEWLVVPGDSSGDSFGKALSGIGDLDGDGQPDLLVGAPTSDANGLNSGVVKAISGVDGSEIFAFAGEFAGNNLGGALTSLGDLNGDGLEDFAVSAPFFSQGSGGFFAGRVYLVSGTGTLMDLVEGGSIGGAFGVSLAAVDLDEDGQMELAVGAIGEGGLTQRGALHYYEWDGNALVESVGPVEGQLDGEMLGWSCSSLGDSDGNPGEEIAIGSPFATLLEDEEGVVSIWSGDTDLDLLGGQSAGAHLGVSVSAGKDLTGDGVGDLIAGAPDADAGTGKALVLSGADLQEISELAGSAAGDLYGWSVQIVSDASFDGLADVVVGAPGANDAAGRVEVIDVVQSEHVESTIDGDPGSELGAAMARLGDVNDTGFDDLVIGAPLLDEGSGETGEIQVWTPPITDVDPPDLEIDGTWNEGTDLQISVTNLNVGADIYVYIALNQGESVTADGFTVDIMDQYTGAAGPLVAEFFEPATATDTLEWTWEIPFGQTEIGSELHVQVVEDFLGLQRLSDVVGNPVGIPPFTLEVGTSDGEVHAGQNMFLHSFGGNRNSFTYFYYSLSGPGDDIDPGPFNNWSTGLSNPVPWPEPFVNSDEFGVADSSPVQVPGGTTGVMVWFSAFSWAPVQQDQMLSNILAKTIQ